MFVQNTCGNNALQRELRITIFDIQRWCWHPDSNWGPTDYKHERRCYRRLYYFRCRKTAKANADDNRSLITTTELGTIINYFSP